MNIDAFIEGLRDRLTRCQWNDLQIANLSGSAPGGAAFSRRWLSGFRSGSMGNPQIKTLKALDWVLTEADRQQKEAA